jgi:hypothetical protein
MSVLNSTQRGYLEKAVIKARRLSVRGAYNTLKAFAVDNSEPYSHMSADDRELRNHLRSKARLLGDSTISDGSHTIDKLAYELAYEYWHQMLFAKFLEANELLWHPEHEIAVSLEECEELGQEEGFDDKWQAAASYASKMLPAIFRQDDPLIQLNYATEDRLALEQLIESISEEVFQADDSLGWVYQYWQTEEKERINAEGNKIDGDSISAVTQLFTEPYMVHFLIDNTLGAWWAARNPGITSPYEFKYLRTLDDGTPAAGSFDGWPETLSEITMLDPCMGSGHFVVDVFMAMATLRMHDENLSKAEACDAVIIENIHGLELDARCTQIAAFNLALTAWKFCGEYRILPEMNLACCGIAPKGKKGDWVKLANSEQDAAKRTRLRGGLERMYDLFQQAPELGSLIDPTTIEKDMYTSDFEELQPFLQEALTAESGDKVNERAVIAAGVAKAGALLAKRYVWQITNVPYLSRGKQDLVLYDFCDKFYPKSKNDLATVFYEKMLRCNTKGGTSCAVIPQNWLFINNYKQFRINLLKSSQWSFVVRLGAKAFQTPMWDFNVMLIAINKENNNTNSHFLGGDFAKYPSAIEKQLAILSDTLIKLKQSDQLKNPDARLILEKSSNLDLLNKYSYHNLGISTGDSNRFYAKFWEVKSDAKGWENIQGTVSLNCDFGGCDTKIFWEKGEGQMYDFIVSRIGESQVSSWLRGHKAWRRKGVLVSSMGNLPTTQYLSNLFDENTVVITPLKAEYLIPIWCFCSDENYVTEVRKRNQKLNVRGDLIKIPFDLEHWQKIADEKYPNGLPKPYSDDPTQWLFHGHPLHTESPLQVAIARLMGYEWPAENDEEMELSDEAKEKIKAIKELKLPFDEDGIVCIPSVNGEASASDRIRDNIIAIWGEDYEGSTLSSLIAKEGSNKRDLETYLREDYFVQHCKLFKNKPFIWHIWDGRKDGFAALVNYHKLDKATLEKLIYTYLGDWINQCDLKMQNNVSGADGLLSAAKALKEKLVLILEGEPPYDLFIRWKSLEEQPIGWEPDINDGVRMNVYPFIQAGVLRKKFNVKWGKDRGKNPSGSHWGPDRWNRYEDIEDEWKLKDEHKNIIPSLSNKVKRKAKN